MTAYTDALAALQAALVTSQPDGAIYPERLRTLFTDVLEAISDEIAAVATSVTSVDGATGVVSLANSYEPLGTFKAASSKTASASLALTDVGKLVLVNSGSAVALTVDPQASVAWPDRARIDIIRQGAGELTFTAGSGVTIYAPSGTLAIGTRYGKATLYRIASDTWILTSDPGSTVTATTFGDADATMSSSYTTFQSSAALTAARTLTLPAASAYPAGTSIRVSDVFGGVTATNTLTLQQASSDTINGSTSVVVADTNGGAILVTDGTSKWAAHRLTAESAKGKHAVWLPAQALVARTTGGAASGTVETTTNKIMLATLDFDDAAEEFAQFQIRMPKSWNEGTVTATFTWSHASTSTNFGVVWAIQAVALSDGDPGDGAFGTAQQVADAGGTTNTIYQTAETPAMTIGGSPNAQDWVVFQVKRVVGDASDTMAIDARLHGVTLFLTTDALTDA